jgi:hypothetical protein
MYDYDEYREPERSLNVPVTITVSWSDAEVVSGAVESVTQHILSSHQDAIKKRVFEGLDALINEVLEETINKEVTLTDSWGKPQGKPTSVRALLQQSAEDWLTTIVDQYGSKARYGKGETRAQYLFNKAIGESLTGRVKKIIVAEVGNLDELIAAEVKKQLRQTIAAK